MKKQVYQHPVLRIVKIQHAQMLCTSVNGVTSNAGLQFNGDGGTGPARGRQQNTDEWENWE